MKNISRPAPLPRSYDEKLSHKAVFQHVKFKFCGSVWQFYEDSISSWLSISNQVTEHQDCMTRCPDALPGLDVLLEAPICMQPQQSLSQPSIIQRQAQLSSQDLYQAMVMSTRPERETAPSHCSHSRGLMPQRISEPTRSHAADAGGTSPGLAPRRPLGTHRCGVAVSPAAGTQTARGPSA